MEQYYYITFSSHAKHLAEQLKSDQSTFSKYLTFADL